MAFGGTGPWLPRRSSDYDVNFAMTLLPPLLVLLGALAATSAAPMTASAAPAWRAPLQGQVRAHGQGHSPGAAHGSGGGASTLLGAALGGGLGAGIGGRTLGELAESELDRYAFLMLDPAASGADSIPAGTVTRRITPKSVFIAPSINGDRDQCAEGYQPDEMGRCVKVIKVDAEKSWDLLLDKLNSQFADLPFPLLSETTTPPGPPPGPFQLAIPIAGLPAPEGSVPEATVSEGSAPEGSALEASAAEGPVPDSPSTPEPARVESPIVEQGTSEQATETVTEAVDEEETLASTTPSPSDEDTEPPTSTPAGPADVPDVLVPEVVMLTSEEQPHAVPAPAAQVGAYLVTGGPAITSEAVAARPASNQSDVGDANPIINTVNNSPLVTGESLVQEVPPEPDSNRLVAEASSLQQLLAAALGMPLATSTTSAPPAAEEAASSSSTTVAPVESSSSGLWAASTTESPLSSSSSSSVYDVRDEGASSSSPSPVTREWEAFGSSTATSTASPPVTPAADEQASSTTSATPWSSSDESRPTGSNLLRPGLLPVLAPAVRFPSERPSSPLRFPSIDVTFPTSRGGVGGSGSGASGGDANRLPVDKPVVFPKDVYWPPLAAAPYWSLEQTRNRPQQQSRTQHNRFWQSRPSHSLGFGGPNTLSTSGGTSLTSSFSPSSSSSSSSSSQEGSQARRRTHYRAGSGALHTHRSSTHRRGREW